MKRSHGSYNKQSRNFVSHGRLTTNQMLATYEEGDRVLINANPRYKRGQPHLRFNHREGTVIGTQGNGLRVRIKDGDKFKELIVTTNHVTRVTNESLEKGAK
ncbi:50S ribosomal protein L21e [uncultured archaeon]|nr:50S ribosomal protein L21e [uncultured archaeon]